MAENLVRIWPCPVTKTGKKSKAKDAHVKCAKLFSEQNHFELFHTADNGDCFFNTLTKFAIINNYKPLLLLNNNNSYSYNNIRNDTDGHPNDELLRNKLVDHIEENLHNYIAFINNTNESVEEQLQSLRQSGVWNANIGDLVPPAGANAFQININLYNIEENSQKRDVIKLEQYFSEIPSDIFVNIIRMNEGHFELLMPISNKRNNVEEKKESDYNQTAITAALIATKAAQVAIDYAEKISNKNNNVELASSLLRNKNDIKNMINQLEESSLSIKNKSESYTRNKVNNIVNNFSNLSLKERNVPPKRRSSRITVKKLSKVENSVQPKRTTRSTIKKSLASQNQNKKRITQNELNNSYIPSMNKPRRITRTTRKKKINNDNNAEALSRAIEASKQNNNLNNNMRAALRASEQNY